MMKDLYRHPDKLLQVLDKVATLVIRSTLAAARQTGSARLWNSAEQFAHFTRLARQIEMARFVRPRDISRFDEGVALAARYVIRSGEIR